MGPHQDQATQSSLAITQTISSKIQMPRLKCKPLPNSSGLNIRTDQQTVPRIKMEGITFTMKGCLAELWVKLAEALVVLSSTSLTQVMLAISSLRAAVKAILLVQKRSLGIRYHFKIMVCLIRRIRVSIRIPLEMIVLKRDLLLKLSMLRVARCQTRNFRLSKPIRVAIVNHRLII